MRNALFMVFFLLCGCAANPLNMSSNMAKLKIGMGEESVKSALGEPTAVSATENVKIFTYVLYNTSMEAITGTLGDKLSGEKFYVAFDKEGKVAMYGGQEVLQSLTKSQPK